MLKRKVYDRLIEWKNNNNKKSLVVTGARQVGKTYIIRKFGLDNYKEILEINFKEYPEYIDIFKGNLNVESIIQAFKFRFPEYSINPRDTLVFFDEIQECEEAITSLKFWTINGEYDVICSGSMLGIDYKKASSYPVGYVEYLKVYALDFEEFLWSQGIKDDNISYLRELYKKREYVPDSINKDMMDYYRRYIALGGMPEVVDNYVNKKDYQNYLKDICLILHIMPILMISTKLKSVICH